jgi:hypothetical protein
VIALYWKPVYRFIRLKFRKDNEEAKDLTQGFFATALGTLGGRESQRGPVSRNELSPDSTLVAGAATGTLRGINKIQTPH